jgi:hypothetical protein
MKENVKNADKGSWCIFQFNLLDDEVSETGVIHPQKTNK